MFEVIAMVCALKGPCDRTHAEVVRFGRSDIPNREACVSEGYAILMMAGVGRGKQVRVECQPKVSP